MAHMPASPFIPMFEGFRDELNEHHDRRERVFKASRDITALGKKMIFSLQRVRQLKKTLPGTVKEEITSKLATIYDLLVSVLEDLRGVSCWRYQRQISGAVQEYIEAVSFRHYLETQTLISPEEAATQIPGDIQLTEEDYILGIFDLVGELMRFGITAMATSGHLPGEHSSGERGVHKGLPEGDQNLSILVDLRLLRSLFEALDVPSGSGSFGKGIGKKMEVMKICVEKVEIAVYGMIVRGQERPKGWIPDYSDTGVPGFERQDE